MMLQLPQNITIQPLKSPWLNSINAHVLRLDLIHPIVSGNKWFKLKHHLQNAFASNKKTVATFGGAYSNHIVATALACRELGLKSMGIIRGEKTALPSHTLQQANSFGMELIFVSREAYRNKEALQQQFDNNFYWIAEGGYGIDGMNGAREILKTIDAQTYTHIIAACGTGTMLAGLINSALPQQIVIGISALKGHTGLLDDVKKLLPTECQQKLFIILHDYHFGGYAKHPTTLINWMKELWQTEQLPTDIIYTSKLLYAVKDLCSNNFFLPSNKLLIIHSGGLQGNLSLPKGILPF
jgi:1-aminocyclopropane-1-carboxylate deaminase